MHDTALKYCQLFYDTYVPKDRPIDVMEIGSQDVNGSIRDVFTGQNIRYTGVDFVPGKGVDHVLDNPYKYPYADNQFDVVLGSSVLEHSELFWLSYLEMIRVLKPGGLLYINTPSNGHVHRYPVDCWRFYPDSGKALQKWAQYNNYNAILLESFIGKKESDIWNDFVAVFVKESSGEPRYVNTYPQRIIDSISDYTNAALYGVDDLIKFDFVFEE